MNGIHDSAVITAVLAQESSLQQPPTAAAASASDFNNEKNKTLSLLILLNQTFSKEQKQLVLQKLNSSLNQLKDASISSSCIVDLQEELNYIIDGNQQDFFNFDQEYRAVSKNDNFEFELLINSTQNSFKRALRSFLQSPSHIKNFIYAGIDYNGSANLVLQDSLFSYDDFNQIFNDSVSSLGSGDASKKTTHFNFNLNSKYINDSPNWKSLEKTIKNFKLLTPASTGTDETTLNELTNFSSRYLNERTITDLMEETKITGALNVEKPALYVFPAREGDCSFFTFNGYSILVDGGYDRVNPSFWRFASMLKQIDSVMFTHQDADALGGLSSLFAKKLVQPNVKPNVLSIFGNLSKPRVHDASLNDADVISDAADQLKIKLQPLVKRNQSQLKPHQTPEHVNLYFKHGYGSLDMYVLSPFENSSEYKEFLHQTNSKVQTNVHKSQLNVNQTFKNIPVSHLCSAVVLLAWTPVKVGDNAVRILYTGNAPQHVIGYALDKIKDFDLLQAPVYKVKGDSAPISAKKAHQKAKLADSGDKPLAVVQNGNDKKPVAKQSNNDKSNDKPAALNASSSVPNATKASAINGASKPTTSAAATANAPATSAKPPISGASKQVSTNGSSKKEVASSVTASNAEAIHKKPETSKKPSHKEQKEEPQKDENKEAKKPPTTARPPVPKKEEAKAKSETTTSRSSIAPVASKSEQNTKATSSTASAAPQSTNKPRPSSSKPNVKPEKEEKVDNSKKATNNVPKQAAKAVTENKPKQSIGKEAKSVSKPPKTESKKEDVKSSIIDESLAASASVPIVSPSEVVLQTETVDTASSLVQIQDLLFEPIVESSSQTITEVKIDFDSLLIKHDIDLITNDNNIASSEYNNGGGDFHDQEEDVRKELASENKFDFNTSECVLQDLQNHAENVANDDEHNNKQQEIKEEEVEMEEEISEDNNKQLESPQLSPIQSSGNIVHLDTEIKNEECRNLELNLEEVQPLVVDPHELIDTPKHSGENSPVEPTLPQDDIMTRSFIDNGENSRENPFLPEKSSEDATSNDNSLINDFGAVQQEASAEVDNLIDAIGSIKIQNDEIKNVEVHPHALDDHNDAATNEHVTTKINSEEVDLIHELVEIPADNKFETPTLTQDSDPSTWNLLNLPKPVNPNESATTVNGTANGATGSTASNGSAVEKKPTTPGAKQQRGPPLSTSSPTASSNPASFKKDLTSETGKSIKASLNTSVNKPSQASTASAKAPVNGSASVKSQPIHPLYFEVSYIPAHGNPHYVDSEFFKRVRARFYVLSSIEPSQNVLNALLDAKQTWEDKELQVSIIPTYESDTLRRWFMLNEEQLAKHKIDVLPAANQTTLTIDNNSDFSCNVHKLDF